MFLYLEVQERKEGDLLIAEMGDVNDGVEAEDGKDGDGDEGGFKTTTDSYVPIQETDTIVSMTVVKSIMYLSL